MRAWVVPERLDERVLLERVLHDTALDSLTAAVHEPQLAQPLRVRRVHVLLNDRRDVPRQERVQVELWADREIDGFIQRRPGLG